MSEDDRRKWNQRYAAGAYQARTGASAWLRRWLPSARVGRALDVACGLGRNARHLAREGYRVDAVDISAEGLQRAAQVAAAEGLEVNWLERDLEAGLSPECTDYHVIVLFRYVNAPLLNELASRLAAGGYLIVEEHLRTAAQVAGPANPAFRVGPGELSRAAVGLQILAAEECVVEDPDGTRVALARLAARKAD